MLFPVRDIDPEFTDSVVSLTNLPGSPHLPLQVGVSTVPRWLLDRMPIPASGVGRRGQKLGFGGSDAVQFSFW